jgi:hypothetical protein
VLVAALLHFPELKSELELLGFGRDADLSDDQAGHPLALGECGLRLTGISCPFLICLRLSG